MADETTNTGGGNGAATTQNTAGGQPGVAGSPTTDQSRRIAELESQLGQFTSQAAKQAEQQRQRELADLKTRADAAETELRTARTKDAFSEAAAKARVKNSAKLFALVSDSIEYDDAGKPKNVAAVIERARKDFPEEFGATGSSVDGGASGKSTPGASVDDFIRKALA
jgi:hypothetical protein